MKYTYIYEDTRLNIIIQKYINFAMQQYIVFLVLKNKIHYFERKTKFTKILAVYRRCSLSAWGTCPLWPWWSLRSLMSQNYRWRGSSSTSAYQGVWRHGNRNMSTHRNLRTRLVYFLNNGTCS